MKNQLKTILLLGILSVLLLFVGGLVSPAMLWVMGLLVVVLNLGAYFLSDRLVLAMNRARELTPQEPLSGASVARWFSTHPPIAERIKRLHELAEAR